MPPEAEPKLAGDFPAATEEQWLALVDKVLNGAPIERLDSVTPGGIAVHPLYRRSDSPGQYDESGLPGSAPFTRGGSDSPSVTGGWQVRALISSPSPVRASRSAVRGLERGGTELLVRFDSAFRAGVVPTHPDFAELGGEDGVLIATTDDLKAALEGVLLDLAPVHLQPGSQYSRAADLLIAVWERAHVDLSSVKGGIGADPLGTLAEAGKLPQGLDAALDELGSLATRLSTSHPHVTAVSVATTPYVESGASETQELAIMLSTGAAYLRAMATAGLDVDAACSQIEVTLSSDTDVFTGVAKLRAARRLWSAMTSACGASDGAQSVPIHVRTATRMMTRRDPWVNLLRVTAAAFVAGIGGATSVTTSAYDSELGESDELGERLARNTQLLLQEESNISRVLDPMGGSWYVESLTDEVATAGWSLFQELEAAGGMPAVLLDGSLSERIATVRVDRLDRVARRIEPLTGVSEFPNIDEPSETKTAPDLRSLRSHAIAAHVGGDVYSVGPEPTICTPLPRVRWAQEFEALRDASDSYLAATGTRPSVFLVNLGPVSAHTARSTFAKNFFETGGIRAVTGEGGESGYDDPSIAVAEAMRSGAHLVCLCSSDALYDTHAVTFACALSSAGLNPVYLAGNPGDSREELQEAGVKDFIHLKVDALAILQAAHESIGTPSGAVKR